MLSFRVTLLLLDSSLLYRIVRVHIFLVLLVLLLGFLLFGGGAGVEVAGAIICRAKRILFILIRLGKSFLRSPVTASIHTIFGSRSLLILLSPSRFLAVLLFSGFSKSEHDTIGVNGHAIEHGGRGATQRLLIF